MAILFAGSERGDFYEIGALLSSTSLNYRDAAHARQAIGTNNGSFEARLNAPSDTAWATFNWGLSSATFTSNANMTGVVFSLEGSAGAIFRVRRDGTNSSWMNRVEYWNGSTWALLTTFTQAASYQRVTAAVRLHATDGFFRWYIGTALIAEFAGNTLTLAGLTALTKAVWNRYGAAAAGPEAYVSEVLIKDENTTSGRLIPLGVTGNGSNTGWTGDFTAIREVGRDPADMIYSNTAGQIVTFTHDAVDPVALGTRVIDGVVLAGWMKRGNTGPQDAQAAFSIGGVNYATGSFAPDEISGPRQVVVAANPATSTAWTKTSLDAAEIGLKSVAA